jgi:UDP-N-acetylmuramoyl-L-alanyl-D-glutamate--2,6-diaminopimelate ligase
MSQPTNNAALPVAPAWSRELTTLGVTGTNGKTSTTRWLGNVLARLSSPVAMATTLGSFLDDEPIEVEKTWDGFVATMRAGYERGGKFASIELTSESLARGFAKVWPCTIGVFTNLTHDHLDAHGTPEHYLASKAQLFVHLPRGGTAVLNGCDPSSALLSEVIPEGVRVLRYGTASRGEETAPLDLRATRVDLSWRGTTLALEASDALRAIGDVPASMTIRAIGDVYAENAMAALVAGMAAGVPVSDAVAALERVAPPRGRFEVVSERPYVVVDYAHTPDALARTLAIGRRLCGGTRGKLVVVFGAGGNRDRNKREPMGEAATAADAIVLTSDNPRDEDAGAIAGAIKRGITKKRDVVFEIDRAKAIELAIARAAEDDVIIIAGKGHESEQIIGNVTRPFDDIAVARSALSR